MVTKRKTIPTDPWQQRLENEWFHHKHKAVPRPPPASRALSVGQIVRYGALLKAEVLEAFEGGLYGVLRATALKSDRLKGDSYTEEPRVVYWTEVLPMVESVGYNLVDHASLETWDKCRLTQSSLDSLLHSVGFRGIQDAPEYQRGYVWTDADRACLLDSIFQGTDIGKLVLVTRPTKGAQLEVLDGKQRLSALLDFTESRFPYRGVYWHELDPYDRFRFESHPVQWITVDGPKVKQSELLRLFLMVNSAGVPQSPEHLEAVRALYVEALSKESAHG